MSKRFWSILLAGALVSSIFTMGSAQAAPPVPEVANIEDPLGDSNTLSGDVTTPAGKDGNVSNVGDLRKIWFTNTAETVSLHIQTTAAPPASAVGVLYTLQASPGEGSVSKQAVGCLQFRVYIPGGTQGGTYQGRTWAKVLDRCNEGSVWLKHGVEGEVVIEKLEDGTGLTTMTFPRSYSTLLSEAPSITAPVGRSDALAGTDKATTPETPATNPAHPWTGFRYDDTKVGTDYTFTSGGDEPSEPPAEDPPPGEDPPKEPKEKKECKKQGKGKGKGKGKNKGCKNGKGPKDPKDPEGPKAACAPFVPGEKGAEVERETVILTDEHTEEAPLEVEVTLGQSLADVSPGGLPAPFAVTAEAFNVQVQTKNADAGLWSLFNFPTHRDYDLDMFHTDGSYAARSRGFNPAANTPASAKGHGGEHGFTYEKLLGIRTANCGGWTIEPSNHLGEGGKFKIKLWLGEVVTDPQEPGKEKPR